MSDVFLWTPGKSLCDSLSGMSKHRPNNRLLRAWSDVEKLHQGGRKQSNIRGGGQINKKNRWFAWRANLRPLLIGPKRFSSVPHSNSIVSDPFGGSSTSTHTLMPEVQSNKDTIRCDALGAEVPGHCQELMQTLIVCLLKIHLFSLIQKLKGSWPPLAPKLYREGSW